MRDHRGTTGGPPRLGTGPRGNPTGGMGSGLDSAHESCRPGGGSPGLNGCRPNCGDALSQDGSHTNGSGGGDSRLPPPPQVGDSYYPKYPHSDHHAPRPVGHFTYPVSSHNGGQPYSEQEARDREFARKLNAYQSDNGSPVIVRTHIAGDTLLHAVLMERSVDQGRSFAVLTPLFNILLLAGLVTTLAFNKWSVVDMSENPWLGVDQKALIDAGAMCTSCMLDGEWWRIVSSLFVLSGIIQGLFNGFLFAAAATCAGRTGMSMWAFAACTSAGGVVGSLTSAVVAQTTIHSTSSALPAAAAAAAIVAVLSVRRFLEAWRATISLIVLWLGLLMVASLAPFADTSATVAGAAVGALCSLAAMAPFFMKVRPDAV
jgi:hypothetical protein